ncbi:hypothetical protein [Pseudoalteromonas sp. JSTW]|uniref:hypothetical protein n=1 Tax=Pseudoalteromonas sp. JSTW TaxID=2752475 RepID=UPI0015D53889|nr:hypothetical protein [Pseudoalteromonas sp. JSTW]QLJ07237.1 hypothetical protein GZH31_10555 [Pseudoalteromonas sp. JSTW]
MLNINRSPEINAVDSSIDLNINHSCSNFLNLEHMVFTASNEQDSTAVALRCDVPLDAIELDSYGYQHVFYESDNDVCEETLIALKKLGIDVVVYFSDVFGPNFNVVKLEQYAKRFNIKLCHVVLPFCPSGMVDWDDSQWRIFDARLSIAISKVISGSTQNLKLNGGQHHATFH